MTLDESIAELEAGFEHLVLGLRATLHELREENAVLHARLDERRLMAASPAPLIPVDVVPVVDTPPAIARPTTRRTWSRRCAACDSPFDAKTNRVRFCIPCRRGARAATMRQLWVDVRSGKRASPHFAKREQALRDEVDLRLAVSR